MGKDRRPLIDTTSLMLYQDLGTGAAYVLVDRTRRGVRLRDLNSEPGDPSGVVTLGEWDLWQRLACGRWRPYALADEAGETSLSRPKGPNFPV